MFGSISVCEQILTILNHQKTKHCSRLSDIHLDAILHVSATKVQANIKKMQMKCNNKSLIDCINYNKRRKNIH